MVIREQRLSSNQIKQVLAGVLSDDLHAKRVASLSDATLGVLRSASLAVCAIGQGLAAISARIRQIAPPWLASVFVAAPR